MIIDTFVDDYHFPVVTLSDKTDAAAICTIFETLNRTGVKLSPFELLTARFWPENVKLRDLWDNARSKHAVIDYFEIDPYYVLQIISLAARSAPGCKRNEVLSLDAKTVTDWWDRATDALADGLKILRDECGVLVPRWLPYITIVIPLAAAIVRAASTRGPKLGANRERLKQWFWCSVFGQTYENSPNSQSAKDVLELVSWFAGKSKPVSVDRFRFDPDVLEDTTQRQRALYRATMCLILRRQTLDFHKACPLTPNSIVDEGIDDHHIFPQKYLNDRKIPARRRDCILNRTLIDRKTNIRISDRAPSDYLLEIREELDKVRKGAFRDVFESHLLPSSRQGPLMSDDFDSFVEWRKQALWSEIQAVTGVSAAADADEGD